MFSLVKPLPESIRVFLLRQRGSEFNYPHVGATRGAAPAGYLVDRNRIRLGTGRKTFERAAAALQVWQMFPKGWIEVRPSTTEITVGAEVAVLGRRFGVWSLNACRIVYQVDESGPITRVGFAYGTLGNHLAKGEERFTVEWHRDDDSVWYDIFAFSKPNGLLPLLVYPLMRNAQKKFARESKAVMLHAANATA